MRGLARAAMALAFGCVAFEAAAVDGCRPIASRAVPIERVALAADEVSFTFIGHSSFLIESPSGVTVETDYNDYVRSGRVPTIATMNRAHSTHYSNAPDPGIRHLLRGWDPTGQGAAEHDVTERDVRVRNVPTNIRSFYGGTGTIPDGNSMFLIEVAGLCIIHLGHLHHTLVPAHLRDIGRVDIALVPVDGTMTLDLDGMMEVIAALDPAIVVPMHVFGPSTLRRFLDRAAQTRRIEWHGGTELIVARSRLTREPRVVVMPGTHPRESWIMRP